MSRTIVENEAFAASPRLPNLLAQSHEPDQCLHSISWADSHKPHDPSTNKLESNESFDIPFGLTTKFGDNGMRMDDFAHADGFTDTDHWGHLPLRAMQAPLPVFPNISLNAVSTSPGASDSATPPSLSDSLQCSLSDPLQGSMPESFQSALHGPIPGIRALTHNGDDADAIFPPYKTTREEGSWLKTLAEFTGGKSMQLPFTSAASACGNPSTGPLVNSTALTLPEHAYPYPQQQSYTGIFPHAHNQVFPGPDVNLFTPGHISPQPTASTSSNSSGSSSPFARSDVFESTARNDSTWRHFDASTNGFRAAPVHTECFAYETNHNPQVPLGWKADTCDPRGIVGEQERDGSRTGADAYSGTIIPLPSHSPTLSDISGSSASGDRGEAISGTGPGQPDFRLVMSSYGSVPGEFTGVDGATNAPSEFMYKLKKKSGNGNGEELLGMGLEDVDERELEFTSRQDTKPTRMLRRQCFNCRTWRDVSAWRRSIMQVGHIVCNKCGLYEKAHKKPRPLNDRGEFIRPGKHVTKSSMGRGRARMRIVSDQSAALGVGVMRFEEHEPMHNN